MSWHTLIISHQYNITEVPLMPLLIESLKNHTGEVGPSVQLWEQRKRYYLQEATMAAFMYIKGVFPQV